MPKGKKPATNNANKSTSKEPPALCIRCPDATAAEKNQHKNDFALCTKQYPLSTTSANTLWWGFTDGIDSLNIYQKDAEQCNTLLRTAKDVVNKTKGCKPEFYEDDAAFSRRIEATEVAKKHSTFEGTTITKGMLEAALVRLAELKEQTAKEKAKGKGKVAKQQAGSAEGLKKGEDGQQMASGLAEQVGKVNLGGGQSGTSATTTGAGTGGIPSGGNAAQDNKTVAQLPVKQQESAPIFNAKAIYCPRCPLKDRTHAREHAESSSGLILCRLRDFRFGDPYGYEALWPELNASRGGMTAEEKARYDSFQAIVMEPDARNDPLVGDMMQALKRGEKAFQGAPFTRALAEAIVNAASANAETDALALGAIDELMAEEDESDSGDFAAVPAVTSPPQPMPLDLHYDANNSAANSMTDYVQRTDVAAVRKYVAAVASNIVGADAGSLSTSDLKKVEHEYGLRTDFNVKRPEQLVFTNYLTMRWPSQLHVYSVDMIRRYSPNGQVPARVKKQADKLLVMNVLKTQSLRQHLNDRDGNNVSKSTYWVSDGDLIWSTKPLFHSTNPSTVPPTLRGGNAVQYMNEMGANLLLNKVSVVYVRTLDLTQKVGEMFYDASAPSWDDSKPGLISRGLNLFFTRFARESGSNTTTTLNKSFINEVARDLDRPQQRTLTALRGYFLSVRPGVQSLYLNVNRATSPFFENGISVDDFITRSKAMGRGDGEIRGILKGVQVRINYDTRVAFPSEKHRICFITNVGVKRPRGRLNIRLNEVHVGPSYQPNGSHGHPTLTVYDWYQHNSPFSQTPEFPQTVLQLRRGEWAVNVGADPNKYPASVQWYPASQLRITDWQKFRGRLTGDQTTEMLRAALRKPDDHWQEIMGKTDGQGLGLRHFGFWGNPGASNPDRQGLLSSNSMVAGTEFIQIPGRWLDVPGLRYSKHYVGARNQFVVDQESEGSDVFQPKVASWNLVQRGFASRTEIDVLPVLNLQQFQMPAQFRPRFERELRTQFGMHGLIRDRNTPVVMHHHNAGASGMDTDWETGVGDLMDALLRDQQVIAARGKRQAQPTILVLMRGHGQDDYACIKRVADLVKGVHTVCVGGDKGLDKWNSNTVSNIALKYNLKGGRDNHRFDPRELQRLRNGTRANTIVLGADCAHPMKGAHTATPSIAAVVGSTDDEFMLYPGSMRLQPSRKEDIVELGDMVKERLIDWAFRHQLNGQPQLPDNVLFYRDGVSESQYDILRSRELPQIQNAFNAAYRYIHRRTLSTMANAPPLPTPPPDHSLQDWQSVSREARIEKEKALDDEWAASIASQANNIPFNLTFVVVGKRHNTRFYPSPAYPTTSDRSSNNNVIPGLVVDQVITHPYSMDFYLQSHRPIQGTGRSAHYFVLQNNMGLTANELQSVTHAFCYAYARATRGVSYCAPAYYADKLCDRGRAYLRHYFMGIDGYEPRPQRHRAQDGLPKETHEEYLRAVLAAVRDDPHYRPYYTANAQNIRQDYGQERQNPWHPNLDGTMFYL